MLGASLWGCRSGAALGTVIVNPATGVLAAYYARYAAFLAGGGFDVLTYDYRGIGRSRPKSLRGCGYRWRDWGEKDFDAVLGFAKARAPHLPVYVVGHSIGGFLPGLAENCAAIDRMLTVGAQYAYWPDYARGRRGRLFWKWHLVMPVLTALYGHFPGRRLGWLEDLPAGVAHEWSFRRAKMELSFPKHDRKRLVERFGNVRANILAVTASDDEFGTVRAIRRALAYYRNAPRDEVLLSPSDLGMRTLGHFGLFHDRHAGDFWPATLAWLRDGANPWPDKPFPSTDDDPPGGGARERPYFVRYY